MATRTEWAKRPGRSSSFIQRSTRFAIYYRDDFDCVYCRLVFPPAINGQGLTLDHLVPRAQGGSHRPENLVTACMSCNCSKQHRLSGVLYPNLVVSRRIAAAIRKPLDRKVGRLLADLAKKSPVWRTEDTND
jgi:hypothetical protein